MGAILVVEADEQLRRTLQLALRGAGHEPEGVATLAAAGRGLDTQAFAAFVLPAEAVAGMALRRRRDAVVIAVAADDEAGLRAISGGAVDYVAPGADPALVLAALRKAEARARAAAGAGAGAARGLAGGGAAALEALVGGSAPMLALKGVIARVAPHKTTVLVRGESGTGKELVARAVHALSPRGGPDGGPFVAVNCAAIPAGLLESELFGHRRGAFTDAVRDRQGLVEQAAGGTLFLDEIAELPPPLQVKLLRVLEDQRVRRLGDDDAGVVVDVRVLAATARPLEAEVAAGRFREDLFYRLDVLTLRLPALRERVEDLPALVEHFLARARVRLGLAVSGITAEAMRRLAAYPWPGNVRELENTIERAAVLCEGAEIDAASLPDRLRAPPPSLAEEATAAPGAGDSEEGDLSIRRATRRAEVALIRRALARTGGNRTRAAELLEISHRALLYKIKEHGL
jgi:two-component system, NtrC family, response regulator AtoC